METRLQAGEMVAVQGGDSSVDSWEAAATVQGLEASGVWTRLVVEVRD